MENLKINEEIKDYLQRKGIVDENRAFMKENAEEIDALMAREGLTNYQYVDDNSGVIVKVTRKDKKSKKLDKPGLAEKLDIETKDLTMSNLVKMAEDKKVTKGDIDEFTHEETKVKLTIKSKTKKEKGE